MIFRPGQLVSAVSGSIGGLTASQGKTGPYIGQRRRRPTGQTMSQQNHQALFRIVQNEWTDLTDDERTAWRVYAATTPTVNRLGISRSISGWQLFLRVNLFRMGAPGANVETKPRGGDSPVPTESISLTSSGPTNLNLTVDYPQSASNTRLAVYGARTFRPYATQSIRRWVVIDGGTATALGTSIDIYSAFTAVLGAPVTDEIVAAGVRYSISGSTPTEMRYDTVALG